MKSNRQQARSQEFLRGGAIFFEKRDFSKKNFLFSKKKVIKKVDKVFFLEKRNFFPEGPEKVDLSCLWGVRSHPSHPPWLRAWASIILMCTPGSAVLGSQKERDDWKLTSKQKNNFEKAIFLLCT